MTGWLSRGLAAGAVGTALLDAASYADMLVTGRSASDAPGQTVLGLADQAGLALPDDESRLAAYGQLGGLAAGLTVGLAASAARRVGLRLPRPLAVVATGAAAMAATDAPMWAAGVSDPRSWSAADWARDAVPHLAFGLGVRLTLDATEAAAPPTVVPAGTYVAPTAPRRGTALGLLLRSAALGAAAGARSSFGVLAPALGHRGAGTVAAALAATEVVVDKLPATPSRLSPSGELPRLGAGALGAAALAHRDHRSPLLPAAAGAAGAFAGTVAGAAWRAYAEDRGWTWQGGLVEDAAALALVGVAVRG